MAIFWVLPLLHSASDMYLRLYTYVLFLYMYFVYVRYVCINVKKGHWPDHTIKTLITYGVAENILHIGYTHFCDRASELTYRNGVLRGRNQVSSELQPKMPDTCRSTYRTAAVSADCADGRVLSSGLHYSTLNQRTHVSLQQPTVTTKLARIAQSL